MLEVRRRVAVLREYRRKTNIGVGIGIVFQAAGFLRVQVEDPDFIGTF